MRLLLKCDEYCRAAEPLAVRRRGVRCGGFRLHWRAWCSLPLTPLSPVTRMHSVLDKLKKRRLVQFSLTYLAAAWLLYQILESLGGAWGITPRLLQVTQVLLGIGFFIALVLTWYHGELGRQRVTTPELTIIAALLLIGGLLLSSVPGAPPARDPISDTEFRSLLDGGATFALSPDGQTVATVVGDSSGTWLSLREVGELDAQVLPGTDGASDPFYSPDGLWVGFVSNGQFRKVSTRGGDPVVVGPAPIPLLGASWGSEDRIVYSGLGTGLMSVSSNGGQREVLTVLESDGRESDHAWPHHTPNRADLVFTSVLKDGTRRLGRLSPETGSVTWLPGLPTTVLEGQGLVSGGLLYSDGGGGLWVVPPRREDERGMATATPTGDIAATRSVFGVPRAPFSYSSGSLLYPRPQSRAGAHIVALSPEGRERRVVEALAPVVSPDGSTLAVVVGSASDRYIGVVSTNGGPITRLTFDRDSTDPVWFPDGERLAFSTTRDGPANIYSVSVGGGDAEPLLVRPGAQYPHSVSSDSRYLAYYEVTPSNGRDIWVLPLDGRSSPAPFLQSRFNERMPAISPDGEHVAYVSNESGADEIYVQDFPEGGSRRRLTVDGGRDPVWSTSGSDLFYRRGSAVWRVGALDRLADHALVGHLDRAYFRNAESGTRWLGVVGEGEEFVFPRRSEASGTPLLVLVQGLSTG